MVKRCAHAFAVLLPLLLLCGQGGVADKGVRHMKVIGHRGVRNEVPQNTLAGMRRAIELGLDYIELDLRTTADGKIVDIHNSTVDETTDGTGEVAAMTFAEIRRLDAGSHFAPEFRGERIPLFAEELALAKGRIKLYLDMKRVDPMRVLWLLEQFDMVEDAVYYDGVEQLAAMQKANPRVQVMPHLAGAEAMPALAERLHPKYVERGSGPLDQAAIKAAHDYGAQYFLDIQGAGDNEEHILACLRAGVDAIQTDNARLVLDVLRRAGVERPAPGAAPEPPPVLGDRPDGRKVKIIAHRGALRHAPQNTLPATREAMRLGLDYVEVDLRTTADGLLVDIHNDRVDRVTDGEGAVRDLSYARIRTFDAGSWFAPEFKGTRVPLLGEVLALVKGRMGIYIDWKEAEPEPVVRLLQEFDMTRDVLVHADADICRAVRALDPSIVLMPGAGSADEVRALAESLKPQAIELKWRSFSEDAAAACRELGIIPATSLAGGRGDTPEDMRRAVAAGVELIETDDPEMLLEVLRRS
ncbi:MAG: glycerophosphodiester phosphodiesterase family protein [Armatimonadota bacterium]|nr:MAG: glycerophosphodiester phosphodiesterase family protein [Armatimonadota bacterium]